MEMYNMTLKMYHGIQIILYVILNNVIYSCDGKAEFSAASSVSHDQETLFQC